MRTVALIASAILLIAIGIKQEVRKPRQVQGAVPAKSENKSADHAVRILSTGWEMALPEVGQRTCYKGFYVDAVLYANEPQQVGLSIMVLPEDGGLSDLYHFDARNSMEHGILLTQFLDLIAPGSVLIMGSNTTIGEDPNKPEIYNQQVRALFRRIGAISEPTKPGVQSFAYICIKTEDGFKAIAESYSQTRSISLSFLIPADRSGLLTMEPERLLDGRKPLPLDLEQATAGDFHVEPRRQFGQRYYECLEATPTDKAPATATWELGESSYQPDAEPPTMFDARIGITWSGNGKMIGARYVLRINDIWVGDRLILREPGDSGLWLNWQEHIPPMDEPVHKVTVEVKWLGEGPGSIRAMLAKPTLTSGRIEQL
jgi:hypothetical protein